MAPDPGCQGAMTAGEHSAQRTLPGEEVVEDIDAKGKKPSLGLLPLTYASFSSGCSIGWDGGGTGGWLADDLEIS